MPSLMPSFACSAKLSSSAELVGVYASTKLTMPCQQMLAQTNFVSQLCFATLFRNFVDAKLV